MILKADRAAIARAAAILRSGGLVAFPTETVYGLGADATNALAVARIFEAKGRPRFNPLIAHVPSLDAALTIAQFDDRALELAHRFWPGPLTLVLPRTAREALPMADLVTAGLDTIAVRVPSHDIARALLEAAGTPIAAPSANLSGRVSPTRARHVEEDLGDKLDLILDGGDAEAGLESTIVATVPEPRLLRPGAIARAEIEALLGRPLTDRNFSQISSPGQLESHYAPRATLRLNAERALPGEALLGFGPNAPKEALNLSVTEDLREAAANLFAHLRALDATGATRIAVMPLPETGLGEAIADRLRRAAAHRP